MAIIVQGNDFPLSDKIQVDVQRAIVCVCVCARARAVIRQATVVIRLKYTIDRPNLAERRTAWKLRAVQSAAVWLFSQCQLTATKFISV